MEDRNRNEYERQMTLNVMRNVETRLNGGTIPPPLRNSAAQELKIPETVLCRL